MTLTPVDKVEILKGKIRNLFSVDNEEFDIVANLTQLKAYIEEHLDLPTLFESLVVEIDKEIKDRGDRIKSNQGRCDDLEEFKLELAEMNSD